MRGRKAVEILSLAPTHRVDDRDLSCKLGTQHGALEWSGQEDGCIGRATIELRHGKKLLAQQPASRWKHCAHAVAEPVASRRAAPLRNALGKRQRNGLTE